MCVNCDTHILNEAYELLKPLFEEYGRRNVIDAIHSDYHHGHRNNVVGETLWDKGFGKDE